MDINQLSEQEKSQKWENLAKEYKKISETFNEQKRILKEQESLLKAKKNEMIALVLESISNGGSVTANGITVFCMIKTGSINYAKLFSDVGIPNSKVEKFRGDPILTIQIKIN